ncbi:MAG: SH3 domain-containing protein [Clostridia bacterium]|nr:SH3 domain-containing protein [Clostridia bacterium]
MKKQYRLWLFFLLICMSFINCAHAEADPFEGASWNTGIMTGNDAATPVPDQEEIPALTPAPQQTVPEEETQAPASKAVYRYLTCTPSSGVPLYYTSTGSKINTRLARGTLVLVHEYADGRARVTFGGWNGWVDVSSLSEKDPGTGERVGYRYAYDECGSVALYRYGFETAIAYVPSGAKVAITDMKEDGYTYVMHGAVSGWAKNSSLRSKLPEGTTSHEGESYYYRALVADVPGGAVQLYNDGTCGDFSKCGTLPEGTVVKVLSTQTNIRISYGGSEYYVKPKNIFSEISGGATSGNIDTGITIPAPEIEGEDALPESADEPSAGKTESTAAGKSTKSNTANRTTSSKPRVSVELVYLGVIESRIRDADGERLVPTAELEFESEAPAAKRIAYIYAPSTGKCSLWKKASKSSDLIRKCKAGTVVMVLEYGSKFCKILYDGKEGYVLTSCLKFPGSGVEAMGTGRISYKGKTNGSTTVNVRGAGNSDAHKIAEWRTGTVVTVFSHKNGWYEVEYNGVHGWVQDKFLTMDE